MPCPVRPPHRPHLRQLCYPVIVCPASRRESMMLSTSTSPPDADCRLAGAVMSRHVLPPEQRSWLQGQLDAWQEQGIISPDQAGRILGLYESPKETAERHQNTALFVMIALAATLIGLAVILFFAFNWEAMPAVLKLGLIFGVIAGVYAGGFYLRYWKDAPRASEVLFLLGCLLYGAGIALIAQIF